MPVSSLSLVIASGVLTIAGYTLTTRTAKGSELTHNEVDANWSAVQTYHIRVRTSAAAGGSDFISKISGLIEGDRVVLRALSGSTIYVSHGDSGGTLRLANGQGFSISNIFRNIEFMRVESAIFMEMTRAAVASA